MRTVPFLPPAIGCAILLPVAMATSATANQSAQSAPAGDVLLVDFRAVTAEGQPVVDLKAGDVELKIGGRARTIQSLELVELAAAASSSTPAIVNPLPTPFATNASATVSGAGREFVLLFEDESILPGREQPLKEAVGQFLSALSAHDRVTVRSVRQGGLDINATTELGTIRSAMQVLRGRASETETQTEFTCRTQVSLQAIQALLAGATGAVPTYVVYLSGALANIDPQRVAAIGQSSGLCQLRATDLEELGKIAANSAATFYVAHVQDGMGPAGSLERFAAGLENVAGVTGADIVRVTGSNTAAMARIARETSAYYLAGFAPEPGERNDTRRPVEVRVARDRVKVHARRNIVIPKAIAPGARPLMPRDMLRVSAAFTDLPLRAAAYTSRNPGDSKIRIVALFEPTDSAVKLTAAAIGLFDAQGKLTAQWTSQGDDLKRSPVMAALVAAPGIYRMRVAAAEASSARTGAVDSTIQAQTIAASPLILSALVLGVPQSGSFAPRLQFTAADAQALGYVEIYGVPKGANVAVTFELAESENGPAIATGAGNLTAGSAEDVRQVYGGFTIGGLAAGDVLMRAIVTLDGKPVGRIMRTLRKGT